MSRKTCPTTWPSALWSAWASGWCVCVQPSSVSCSNRDGETLPIVPSHLVTAAFGGCGPADASQTKNAAFAAFRGRVVIITGGQTSCDRRKSGLMPFPAAVGWLRLLQPRCAAPPIRVHDDDKAHRKQSGYPFGPPFYLVPQITWRGRKRCITKRKRLKS